jgi:hypothetical protein
VGISTPGRRSKKKAAPRPRASASPTPAEMGGLLGAGVLAALVQLGRDLDANIERRHAERIALDTRLVTLREQEILLREKEIAHQHALREAAAIYVDRFDSYFETFSKGMLEWIDGRTAVGRGGG